MQPSTLSTNNLRVCIWKCSHLQARQLRLLSTTSKRTSATHSITPAQASGSSSPFSNTNESSLSRLPLPHLLRGFLLCRLFASPWLFKPGLAVMQAIANSKSRILDPDRNPVLGRLIKATIYNHFCAGVNEAEIQQTSATIRSLGFSGVSLCYAREVQVDRDNRMLGQGEVSVSQAEEEIKQWRDGLIETLRMVGPGDLMAIKITGAGSNMMNLLMSNSPLPQSFHTAMHEICALAHARQTRILIDAEQQAVQTAIDSIMIDLMRTWNRPATSKPIVYSTIQAYLKSAPQKLVHQLRLAKTEGWSLGIKLVRGAYMDSESRRWELIHDTKADTDNCYNGIVRDLLKGSVEGIGDGEYPRYELLLAGHNRESVLSACDLARDLSRTPGALKVYPEFAQLQGMADDLACEVFASRSMSESEQGGADGIEQGNSGSGSGGLDVERVNAATGGPSGFIPRVYKYLSWGTVRECMQYLVRRAIENQAAAERMKDAAGQLGKELRRRIIGI